jgi:hypothetical protein
VLEGGPRSWEVGLAGYLRVVSAAVGVLPGGVGREFSPPVVFLALSRRSARHPERDLLLVWSAGDGWQLALEHPESRPGETLAWFGEPLVPEPAEVARFVDDVVAGRRRGGRPAAGASSDLYESLKAFAVRALPPASIRGTGPDRRG